MIGAKMRRIFGTAAARMARALTITLAFTTVASATTIVVPTDEQLVEKTPLIVIGVVKSTRVVDRGGLRSESIITVERALKGSAPSELTVSELGGVMGERYNIVFGTPEYVAGERVLLFLAPWRDGLYRTRDLFVGKFSERHAIDGQRLWFRPTNPDVAILDGNLKPTSLPAIQRDGDAFEQFIAQRVSGRTTTAQYQIESPLLEENRSSANVTGTRNNISANFTLLSEPTIFRWKTFDNGGSANWYSNGSQPGYTGGGVNEVQSGMNAWDSYSSAKIRYSYAGARSGAPGGLNSPNGVNEVMFNDPLNEIDGTFNSRTGGVVGLGGFNNTANGGSWTAPFTADASHTAKTYSSQAITEANLVIQDGVTPSAGISSSVLAEIIAHEFGHTLGFGHSADSTALMYYSVTGGGASLKADDQVAARWLYPNGTGGGGTPSVTVPAAPSTLTATLVSGSSVRLDWTDNATNETAQTVYVSTGGTFSSVGDVGAGATTVTINSLASSMSYSFYVTAKNSAGESSPSNTARVTTPSSTPSVTAAFSFTPAVPTTATAVAFTDLSTGSPTSWSWTFGDGSTATAKNPAHQYATAGTYAVSLTVRNSVSSNTTTKNVVVTAPAAALAANFNWSPASPVAGANVAFSDASTGSPTSWSWTFGDGASSTAQNPTHAFANGGTYTVTLAVRTASASNSVSRIVTVQSGAPATPPVVADFGFTPSSPRSGDNVTFTDASTGAPTSWSWNFGDGTTSTAKNPSHVFANSGTYNVTLVVTNASSSNSRSRSIVVSAAAQAFESVIAAAAQTTGLGSTYWRTELSIFNASTFASDLELVFIPGAGGSTLTRRFSISPNGTLAWSNALRDIFALTQGSGAIVIRGSSTFGTPQLKVSSRTFTDGASGTYGQAVPDVPTTDGTPTTYLTGLFSNNGFRTNIGLVNRTAAPVTATLALLDANGNVAGQTSVNVPANNFQQNALTTMFGAVSSDSTYSLRVTAASPNALYAYASVVDNRSQDPIYIPSTSAPTEKVILIPAIGRTDGANGTYWRSDVTLYNPGNTGIALSLRLWRAGQDNRAVVRKSASIAAGRSLLLSDVMTWLGAGTGSGALEIDWSGSTGPIVTSRTYTNRAEDGASYGQSIDATFGRSYGARSVVTGLRSDGSYRTNLGLVNRGETAANVSLTLYSSYGTVAGTAFVTIPPTSQLQNSLGAFFPNVAIGSLGNVTIEARADVATVAAYGSVVDNASGDPIFIMGE